MTDEAGQTISRQPPDEPGAAYATLLEQATELTRAMVPEWTDYNYSDPGVTILEQLCYALTEMPYRAGFTVPDLLVGPESTRVPIEEKGLKPAWVALPCNPVTISDLRRVVIDRVPEAANVWFTPADPANRRGLSGLYQVSVLALAPERASGDPCCGGERLTHDIERCYRAHRALCEDICNVRVLTPLDTWVHAEIDLDHQTDASTTLAHALFDLGLALAPEPARRPLDAQITAEKTSANIFAGPLMLRGFIPEDQLTPLPRRINVDQLVDVLARAQGVVSVGPFSVHVDGRRKAYTRGDDAALPEGQIAWLQATSREGRFTLTLRRDGQRIEPNPARVRRILHRLWERHRQTFPLRSQYARRYGAPRTSYRDLSVYTSLQQQFPNIYGISANGLPREVPPTRVAQARQLKGFLMPFDQMLADYFAQLGFIRKLFSIEAGGTASYAWQSLRAIVPDSAPLLSADYEAGLAAISAASDPVDARRNRILDFLLSLYAQRLSPPSDVGPGATHRDAAVLIAAKQTMLRRVAQLSRDRGRGADYRRRRSARRMSGLERISRLELGLLDALQGDGALQGIVEEAPGGPGWGGGGDPLLAGVGVPLPADMGESLARLFQRIEAPGDGPVAAGPSPFAGRPIPDELAAALAAPDHYRMGRSNVSAAVYVLCVDAKGGWWWLGEHRDEDLALQAIRRMLQDCGTHRDEGRGHKARLHIIDWILLREAMLADGQSAARFNFRVTAVISASHGERDSHAWRQDAEQVVRKNTPAHIALDCLFLDASRMRRFEQLLLAWHEAMKGCSSGRQIHASKALADFLTQSIEGERHPAQHFAAPPSTPAPTSPPPASPTPAPPARPAPTPTPTPTPTPAPTQAPPPVAPPPPPATPEPTAVLEESPPHEGILGFFGHMLRAVGVGSRAGRQAPTPPPEHGHEHWPVHPPSPPTPPATPSSTPEPTPLPTPAPVPEPTPTPPVSAIPPATVSLPGVVTAAPTQALGFDADTVMSSQSAAAFAEAGFQFAVRYLPRTFSSTSGDLTTSEANAILGAGLALMAVQHVASEGWAPSASLGTSYGQCAAAYAWSIGLPAGMNIWLDLEGVAAGTAAGTIQDYCNAWYAAVAAYGYVPGLYVGANCGLSGDQITATAFAQFWQSGSSVPTLSTGYCMIQSISSSYMLDGVAYDLDTTQADSAGHTPIWLAPR